MKTFITTVALGALLVLPSGGLVFAGQPSRNALKIQPSTRQQWQSYTRFTIPRGK